MKKSSRKRNREKNPGKQKQSKQWYPRVKRTYKDQIFRMAFRDKQDLLDLYNAVNRTDYQNADDLTVNTLEDAVYLSMKNDLSFLVGGTMNLYEYQSSWNQNMPVRGFLYLARLYERYINEEEVNLYGESLKKLPLPQYLVFYNGTKEEPDKIVLKLSDAFEQVPGGGVPCLECTAVMLNINYGHNRELMEKCRRLEEYSIFVATVRRYAAAGAEKNLRKAVTKAVDECIERGILRDILLKNKAEVISMVWTSFDQKKYEKAMQKEWKEEGLKAGREEGLKEGRILSLIEQVQKKYQKNKTVPAIADELEEAVQTIEKIYKQVKKNPDRSAEEIYELLK